jgi:hypothetical protein
MPSDGRWLRGYHGSSAAVSTTPQRAPCLLSSLRARLAHERGQDVFIVFCPPKLNRGRRKDKEASSHWHYAVPNLEGSSCLARGDGKRIATNMFMVASHGAYKPAPMRTCPVWLPSSVRPQSLLSTSILCPAHTLPKLVFGFCMARQARSLRSCMPGHAGSAQLLVCTVESSPRSLRSAEHHGTSPVTSLELLRKRRRPSHHLTFQNIFLCAKVSSRYGSLRRPPFGVMRFSSAFVILSEVTAKHAEKVCQEPT